MNHISIDRSERTANIDAGANMGKVYRALWEHGVTIPGGTESSVGVVGLSLGGGIEMLSRPFGLTCDSLIEIELVVADGQEGARLFFTYGFGCDQTIWRYNS